MSNLIDYFRPSEDEKPPIEDCDTTVKWHSIQKHAMIASYLDIWVENVGGEDAPSLDIYDLYAGKGWCYNEEVLEAYSNEEVSEIWPGTAVLAAKLLNEYETNLPKYLHLNTWCENEEELEQQKAALERNLDLIETDDIEIEIISKDVGRAIDHFIESAEEKEVYPGRKFDRLKYPNIWFFDPYLPQQLPWDDLEKVIGIEKSTTAGTRRPEVFINLVTEALQRKVPTKTGTEGVSDGDKERISKALGLSSEEWMEEFERLKNSGCNNREAFVAIYQELLMDFYEKDPIPLKVDGKTGNVVYVMLFCSEHKAGYYMTHQKGLENFFQWKDRYWKNIAKELTAISRAKLMGNEKNYNQSNLSGF